MSLPSTFVCFDSWTATFFPLFLRARAQVCENSGALFLNRPERQQLWRLPPFFFSFPPFVKHSRCVSANPGGGSGSMTTPCTTIGTVCMHVSLYVGTAMEALLEWELRRMTMRRMCWSQLLCARCATHIEPARRLAWLLDAWQ